MGSRSKINSNAVVKELYIEWLRYPNSSARAAAGLPRTKGDFARTHHVDRTTLFRWEQAIEFKRAVMEPTHEIVKPDDWIRILQKQKEKALEGNLLAAKFIGEYLGLKPDSNSLQNPPKDEDLLDMESWTPEKLEAYLAAEDAAEQGD